MSSDSVSVIDFLGRSSKHIVITNEKQQAMRKKKEVIQKNLSNHSNDTTPIDSI